MAKRKILHIDMDAFYASVEQRDNPALKGRPVIVGSKHKRGVVATASYEARKYGVFSSMPCEIARRKCVGAVFVEPRFEVYKEVSAQIRKIFFEYTDLVEPWALDEAYLDVTENKKGEASATVLAKEILERIEKETQLTASAGVSVNKFLAKVASGLKKPNGVVVIPPHQVQEFIDKLPIEYFHGIGKVTTGKMHALGIKNGADLKAKDKAFLVQQFGKAGVFFYEVAHGQDDRPVVPDRERKSLSVEMTFEQDISDREVLIEKIIALSERLETRMEKTGLWGKQIILKVKFSDFEQITRAKKLVSNVETKDHIQRFAVELLDQLKEPYEVRLLGIGLGDLNRGEDQGQMGIF